MDDGTYAKRAHHRIYRFLTHSFPLSDQEILVKVLRDNFGIEATKDRAYYMLSVIGESNQKLVDLIRPYINPCFDYKIQ